MLTLVIVAAAILAAFLTVAALALTYALSRIPQLLPRDLILPPGFPSKDVPTP